MLRAIISAGVLHALGTGAKVWYPGWAACVVHAVVGPLPKQALMTSISIQGYDRD